jgi:hypothetical protein
MKKTFIAAIVTLSVLAICLLPRSSRTTSAYPDNLWTNGGQFSEPSKTMAVLVWNRTEYGVVCAWLVHDSCTTESSWYVRIEPRYLMLYSVVAFLGGLTSIVLPGIPKKRHNRVSGSD